MLINSGTELENIKKSGIVVFGLLSWSDLLTALLMQCWVSICFMTLVGFAWWHFSLIWFVLSGVVVAYITGLVASDACRFLGLLGMTLIGFVAVTAPQEREQRTEVAIVFRRLFKSKPAMWESGGHQIVLNWSNMLSLHSFSFIRTRLWYFFWI